MNQRVFSGSIEELLALLAELEEGQEGGENDQPDFSVNDMLRQRGVTPEVAKVLERRDLPINWCEEYSKTAAKLAVIQVRLRAFKQEYLVLEERVASQAEQTVRMVKELTGQVEAAERMAQNWRKNSRVFEFRSGVRFGALSSLGSRLRSLCTRLQNDEVITTEGLIVELESYIDVISDARDQIFAEENPDMPPLKPRYERRMAEQKRAAEEAAAAKAAAEAEAAAQEVKAAEEAKDAKKAKSPITPPKAKKISKPKPKAVGSRPY